MNGLQKGDIVRGKVGTIYAGYEGKVVAFLNGDPASWPFLDGGRIFDPTRCYNPSCFELVYREGVGAVQP